MYRAMPLCAMIAGAAQDRSSAMGYAWFLNPKDRLIPGSLIGHKAIAVAIDHQVEIFKHDNAQKNLLPKYHSRCDRFASKHFYRHGFRHIHFFNATISIFGLRVSESKKPKTVSHSRRNS
jgi:hypothetical protein